MVYKYYKSQGSGRWLGLSKITGQAKICLRPSTLPGLAWLFLAWPGLASGLRPEPAHHYFGLGISDSEIRPRNSEVPRFGPEIPRSRSTAPKSGTRKCATRKCATQNMQLVNMHLGNTHLGNSGLGTRKYRTQDMQLGNAHLRNANTGLGNTGLRIYNSEMCNLEI